MIETGAIRGFLLRKPRAVLIRISDDQGMTQELRPQGEMARVAETIAAMRPTLLEALDKDDRLIRAMRCDEGPDTRRASDAAPVIPAEIAADPHALMVTHFANLLHRAYEHSTAVAFAKMVELVQLQNERSASIEQRLERTEANYRRVLHDQIDDAFDKAEQAAEQAQAGDAKEQIVNSLVQGVLQGQHTNGAAHANGKGK